MMYNCKAHNTHVDNQHLLQWFVAWLIVIYICLQKAKDDILVLTQECFIPRLIHPVHPVAQHLKQVQHYVHSPCEPNKYQPRITAVLLQQL